MSRTSLVLVYLRDSLSDWAEEHKPNLGAALQRTRAWLALRHRDEATPQKA